jgi:hypothetical protein
MPLPNRKLGEEAENFISRCMSSEKMMSEFSDQKQRYAICRQQSSKAQEVEYKPKPGAKASHVPDDVFDKLVEMLESWEDKDHPYYKDLAKYVTELTQEY